MMVSPPYGLTAIINYVAHMMVCQMFLLNIARCVEESWLIKVNTNQKIVLDYIKEIPFYPVAALRLFFIRYHHNGLPTEVENAAKNLNEEQQLGLLLKIAKWVLGDD
jgi:hypothetical protein